jgi:hypothetical protein
MFTHPNDCGTTGLAAKLAIDEVAALMNVIARASDGESVRNWSRSTITNVLYAVEPTDRIVFLVHQAQSDALSFAAKLSSARSDRDQTKTEALREAAMQSVQGLICAMKNGSSALL